jgi:hypothetical protein
MLLVRFFDYYIIPLAKKLKDCGVFGVSSEEYLNYALKNRAEWESKGNKVIAEMMENYEVLHSGGGGGKHSSAGAPTSPTIWIEKNDSKKEAPTVFTSLKSPPSVIRTTVRGEGSGRTVPAPQKPILGLPNGTSERSG